MKNPNLADDKGEEIARLFSLGRFESITLIKGGLWNYNYIVKTDKGEFIARFSSFELDNDKKERLFTQFKVLNYLDNQGFEYSVPVPIESINKKYLECIGEDHCWVYKKIEGEVKNRGLELDLNEVASLIARYHRKVKALNLSSVKDTFNEYGGLDKDLKNIKNKLTNLNDKDKIDLLIHTNLDIIEKAFNRILGIDFGNERIIAHSDWYAGNFVLDNNKIIGLLDLDLFEIAPSIKDVALAIQLYCFTADHKFDRVLAEKFLEQYQKIMPVKESEKRLIKDLIIRECLSAMVFFYTKMKKDDFGKREFLINWVVYSLKNMMEDLENDRYF
jgi:homoserine kinase type II